MMKPYLILSKSHTNIKKKLIEDLILKIYSDGINM